MIKKIKNFIFLALFLIFFFLVAKYYFSEKNILFVNKTRSTYSLDKTKDYENLPILQNDTNNIIIYKNDLEEFKKKRKKYFWEKLLSNKDE